MTEIHRLIYVSASREEMTQDKLDGLLAVARTNNSAAGVTGLLLFHDGSFFQVLEGAKDEVLRIFSRIERDYRHSRVIILQTKSAPERAFPTWSMGYMRAHDLRPEQKECLVDLRSMTGTGHGAQLTAAGTVAVHIDAFLTSFREFADL